MEAAITNCSGMPSKPADDMYVWISYSLIGDLIFVAGYLLFKAFYAVPPKNPILTKQILSSSSSSGTEASDTDYDDWSSQSSGYVTNHVGPLAYDDDDGDWENDITSN